MRATTRRRLAAAATTAALAWTLTACASTDEPAAGSATTTEQSTGQTDEQTAGEHDEADTRFAQMMIVHHQGALEMAELALERADDERVRALAGRIRDAQDPEIQLMSGWLEAWGEEQPGGTDHEGMDHGDMDMSTMEMDGMSQEEAMASLEQLEGVDFDRSFLELMTAHHRGAVEMAEQEVADGTNARAVDLARTIADTQTAEIDEMQALLAGL